MLKKQGSLGFAPQKEELNYKAMKERLLDEVKGTFRPEFLNRVDDIIVFHQLTRDDLGKIVEIELNGVRERLAEQSFSLKLTPKAKDFLIEKGFNPVLGARPLKRTIQSFLEDPLSEHVLKAKFKKGSTIKVTVEKDRLTFKC